MLNSFPILGKHLLTSTSKNKPVKKVIQKQLSKNNNKKNIQDIKYELKSTNQKSEENIKRLLVLSSNTIKVKDAEKVNLGRAHDPKLLFYVYDI